MLALFLLSFRGTTSAYRDDYLNETIVYRTVDRGTTEFENWFDLDQPRSESKFFQYDLTLEHGVTDHFMLGAVVHSYDGLPVGKLTALGDLADSLTSTLSAAFAVAVQLSTPFLVLGLAFNIGLALANRALPQLPVFFVGLPASLAGGLIVLMIALPAILFAFGDQFQTLFTRALP